MPASRGIPFKAPVEAIDNPGKMSTPMKFDAIRIHSAPEALVEEVIKQINTGKLEPGTCLPS